MSPSKTQKVHKIVMHLNYSWKISKFISRTFLPQFLQILSRLFTSASRNISSSRLDLELSAEMNIFRLWIPIITELSVLCYLLYIYTKIFRGILLFYGNTETYCVLSWFPSSWTHFSMFISVLESLDQTQSLINTSSYWKVVHGDLSQDSFSIDDEQSSMDFSNFCFKNDWVNKIMISYNKNNDKIKQKWKYY